MMFKNTHKEGEKQPDYRLVAKDGDELVEVGAGWKKQGTKGAFVSFKMKDPYEDKPGFRITKVKGEEKKEEVQSNIDPDDIPF